jgi:hypothetical protein
MQCICKVNDEIFFITKESFFFFTAKRINERKVEDERKKIKKNIMIEKEAKFSDYIFGKKNS